MTSTNIHHPKSVFTIPKNEPVVNKKSGRIPRKIWDFIPALYVVFRPIGHLYGRVLHQVVSTPRAGPEPTKPAAAFRLLGAAVLDYGRINTRAISACVETRRRAANHD
jgi:hypothetical protein